MDNKSKKIELTIKNNQFYSLFYKDNTFSILHSKTEKIIAAIYLVVSLVSDSEHIKGHIKELSLDLLSLVVKLKDNNSLSRESNILKIKNKIFEIISALNICFMSGIISEMNTSVLKKELFDITQMLNSNLVKGRESSFSIRNIPAIKDKFEDSLSYKKIIRDKKMSLTEKEIYKTNDMEYNAKFINGSKRKNARTSAILALIKSKNEVNIKDITETVKNCSEKTIQRELMSLIKMGVLNKTGERRWSRYSLAT